MVIRCIKEYPEHELKFIRFITIILKIFLILTYKKSARLENQSFIC